MSLRQQFIDAHASRPSSTRRCEIVVSKLLLEFKKDIPTIVEEALLRLQAGEDVGVHDKLFFRAENISWDGPRDARTALETIVKLPAMQELKSYLSSPAVDMAFKVELKQRHEGSRDPDFLNLRLIPFASFDKSSIVCYGMSFGYEVSYMTSEDKNAWASKQQKKRILSKDLLNKPIQKNSN